ncbi:HAD hydrolase-like protein [Pannus brasiliensis CCIBt3594]|uniref:HAD hydrolase-like protein n=1 Tax=Pannus brasiliensis CCIBt3594 TaxID=1427578 RepID=A0AAW9R039_9CHRO
MYPTDPRVLALDFDGVICDGMIEYFQTSQRTYTAIWNGTIPPEVAPRFYQLRPVIETGWEMPLLLRAIALGFTDEEILDRWPAIARDLLIKENLDKKRLSRELDGVRDRWIAEDLEGWLDLHRFYPGVIDRLSELLHSDTAIYIITTKESRFVKRLLQKVGIYFPDDRLFGKEVNRPKYATIRGILANTGALPCDFWFVEDRLEALELVRGQEDLADVRLFLADWGYNTARTRDSIRGDSRIRLLTLERFTGDFPDRAG